MTNEAGQQLKQFDIKINKTVKGNSIIKFNKDVILEHSEPRVFTQYKIII